jgi:Fe-S cluster assembly protein SufB
MQKQKATVVTPPQIQEVNRSLYDFKDAEHAAYKTDAGLTEDIVRQISKEKHDPAWMLAFRLQALQIYKQAAMPGWGPQAGRPAHGRHRHLCASGYAHAGQVERSAGGY